MGGICLMSIEDVDHVCGLTDGSDILAPRTDQSSQCSIFTSYFQLHIVIFHHESFLVRSGYIELLLTCCILSKSDSPSRKTEPTNVLLLRIGN